MIGGGLYSGGAGPSALLAGPLGVVKIGWNGYDLGKTNAASVLTHEEDIKDILYQQDGTKAADHVRTGEEYILTVEFAEINTGLLEKMIQSISSIESATADSATLGRSVFQSMRAGFAKGLKVVACDANGIPSTSLQDQLCFYEAIPLVKGDLLNWQADAQRKMPVSFRIKFHTFAAGESLTKFGAFGYYGDPTVEDLPAIVWPDVASPNLLSAAVVTATTLALTFDKNVAIQGVFNAGWYVADVDGVSSLGVSVAIVNKVATVTFAASTFAHGNAVKISVSGKALKDTATPANLVAEIFGRIAANPL